MRTGFQHWLSMIACDREPGFFPPSERILCTTLKHCQVPLSFIKIHHGPSRCAEVYLVHSRMSSVVSVTTGDTGDSPPVDNFCQPVDNLSTTPPCLEGLGNVFERPDQEPHFFVARGPVEAAERF